jgi:hypothetical protein
MAWLAEAVAPPGAPADGAQAPAARLAAFRDAFYGCLRARADALFEVCDAVLCADGPVTSLAELSLSPVFRRGHGALYDALAEGGLDADRLREALAWFGSAEAREPDVSERIDEILRAELGRRRPGRFDGHRAAA